MAGGLEAEQTSQLSLCWGDGMCSAHPAVGPHIWWRCSCFCSLWHFVSPAIYILLLLVLKSLSSLCRCLLFASLMPAVSLALTKSFVFFFSIYFYTIITRHIYLIMTLNDQVAECLFFCSLSPIIMMIKTKCVTWTLSGGEFWNIFFRLGNVAAVQVISTGWDFLFRQRDDRLGPA